MLKRLGVCAEIDIEPEYNLPSMRFQKKGFREVGTRISKQTLTVSLQIKEILLKKVIKKIKKKYELVIKH